MSATKIAVIACNPSPELGLHGSGNVVALADGDRLVVQGWSIVDGAPAAQVEALLGEDVLARAPVNRLRQDVAEALGVPGAERSGFRLALWTEDRGRRKLTVQAVLPDGTLIPLASIEVEVAGPKAGLLNTVTRWWTRDTVEPMWHSDAPVESQKVLVGRDDWLFLQNDSNDVLGQHTGRVALDAAARTGWAELLAHRADTVEGKEAAWLCAIVPDKESVYAEHLPPEVVVADRRPVHQLLDIANEVDAPVVYLLDALEKSKDDHDLYPRTDTHWDYRGAYLGYVAICEELRRRGIDLPLLDEDRIDWRPEVFHGDLGSKVYPRVEISARYLPYMERVEAKLVYDNHVANHGHVKIFERADSEDPRAVVFGESFADSLLLFLRESFSRVCFVHTSMLIPEVITHEKADVVLSVPVERFMVRTPSDEGAWSRFMGEVKAKNGELPWTSNSVEQSLGSANG